MNMRAAALMQRSILRQGASQLQRRTFWRGTQQVQQAAAAPAAQPAVDESVNEVVSIAETERLLFNGIKAIGYSDADAKVMRDAMMWAQLRDNNQGIIKLTSGGLAKTGDGVPTMEIDSPVGGRLNGNQAMSMVVINKGVEVAIEKALANNVGVVGTFNTSQSCGALGFYAEKIANAGLIGLVFATSPEFVAPHGAKQPILGTNPITCALPTDNGIFLMDQATAAFPWFGLLEAKTAGRDIPEGVAFDKDGHPTVDPNAALQGALRTFDRGYKSSNLALMVELIAGPLVGAAHQDKRGAKNWGNLVIAINPALLGDAATFYRSAGEVLDRVRNAEKLPGVTDILIPGQREAKMAQDRREQGSVPLERNMLSELRELAASYEATLSRTSAPAASSRAERSGYAMATRLAHPAGKGKGDPYNASSPVLYQTATFELDKETLNGEYDYTRSGNPTRAMLEEQMADLEGADRSFAFTSGMAALTVAMRLVPSGGHIVTGDDIYGGTSRLLSRVAPAAGISVTNVDMCDNDAVLKAMQPNTGLVWMESPTNPRMQVTDLAAIADIARSRGALSMVDNSIMAPVFQQPLALGADISMTSATKFVAGHSDVTAGILSVRGDELAEAVYFLQNSEGGGLAPYDCWLCLRGLKTMALRMKAQQANCMAMAHWLQAHPLVTKINYPGLPTDPGHALHMRQASGGGSLLSFETGNVELSRRLSNHLKLFKVTVSFGSTSSLVSLPCFMSHASIPAEVRAARGLPDDLVRISAGIEDEADLLADLEQAMAKACAELGISAAARPAAANPVTTNPYLARLQNGFQPAQGAMVMNHVAK